MDICRKCFLEILRCAMAGEPVRGMVELAQEQWRDIAELASLHKVLPLISNGVHAVPGAQGVFQELKSGIRRQVMTQTQKTHAFLELNRKLRSVGIKALVVKGIVCRSLYPNGDLRLSADEDLLVPAEQLGAAKAVLEELGMTTTETAADAHEYPYRGENSPLYIELHAQLFPPGEAAYGAWNGYFQDAFDRAEEINVQGETVWTMAPTDHLLYLILHAFKHFLHSGVGIRQACDIVRCANAWGGRVNWDYVLSCCREVRAECFAQAVFAIGEKYLGLDRGASCIPSELLPDSVDESPLLEDMLDGGVYGDSSRSRKQSSNMTLDAVAAENRGQNSGSGILASIFPKAEKLEGRYPYLKDQPYLLPVAWADRIVHYAGELKKSPDSAAETIAIGSRRLNLLRQYGVID